MRIAVIAVGSRMPRWVNDAFEEYAKRMPKHMALELVEIKPEPRSSGKSAELLCEAEALRISQACPKDCMRIALDERGKEMSTHAFAQWLGQATMEERNLAFLIGGADGLAPKLKQSAQMLLRLSAFTLPHGLARVVLAEQLYRASSILANHPYHRA